MIKVKKEKMPPSYILFYLLINNKLYYLLGPMI
jgi:hypothetical protein